MEDRKLGIAIAGVGEYTIDQLIPALKETRYCQLAGLISGDAEELQELVQKQGCKGVSVYTYDDFDKISNDDSIDIVYIVLPNFMHAEYVIRAAQAGKHIICEKPLGMNPQECEYMVDAIKKAGVQCSMGYRLHFDPFHRELMRLGQEQVFGPLKRLRLQCSMDAADEAWRLEKEKSGGGPLMNNGVYCVQAAIYLTGKLPQKVTASFVKETMPEKFKDVEQGIRWTFFFEDGIIAECESRYDMEQDMIMAEAENGWFRLEPAFAYDGQKGETSEGLINCTPVNQQAAQMDDFAWCILNGRETRVSVEMGLRDMELIAAIYDAARRDSCVQLSLQQYASLPEA